jgi:hypothetical protein
MAHPPGQGTVSRVWLYGNHLMVARIVERRRPGGLTAIDVDGPAFVRGQDAFRTVAAAAAFLADVDRRLVAAGFRCLWRSEDQASRPVDCSSSVQQRVPSRCRHFE